MRTNLPFSTVPPIALFFGIISAVIDTLITYNIGDTSFAISVVIGLRSLGIMTTVIFLAVFCVWVVGRLLIKRKPNWVTANTLVSLQIVIGIITLIFGYIFDSSSHKTVSLIKMQLLSVVMLVVLTPLLSMLIEKTRAKRVYSLRAGVFLVLVILTLAATYISYPLEEKYSLQPIEKSQSAGSASGPNIILIVMDTARADRFGFAGYSKPVSPNLDLFAEESTVFGNAFSTSSWTLPAHASLFTGLYPSQHRASGEHFWLDDSYLTLAEILKGEGYQTVLVSNNANVSTRTNTVQGFDHVWYRGLWQDTGLPARSLVGAFLSSLKWIADKFGMPFLNRWQAKLYGKKETIDAGNTNDAIYKWFDQRDSDKPFLLFVNYMEIHIPYNPPKNIALKYVSEADLTVSSKKKLYWPTMEMDFDLEHSGLTPDDFRIIDGLYDGSIETLDQYLGQLFEALHQRNLYDDTLIVITSDHGEYLGRHNRLLHGVGLHDDVFKIPLLVHYPKLFAAGKTVTAPVNLIDVFETILEISGTEKRPQVDYDAIKLFDENIDESREVYGEVKFYQPLIRSRNITDLNEKAFSESRTVRNKRDHYIWHYREEDELYDTIDDPNEVENLYAENATLATRMSIRLSDWFEKLQIPALGGAPQRQLSEQERLDHLEQLKALGYIK